MQYFKVEVGDPQIIRAYNSFQMESPDSPTEADLVRLRSALKLADDSHNDMLSLHWLRNRVVCLRKAGKLKKAA